MRSPLRRSIFVPILFRTSSIFPPVYSSPEGAKCENPGRCPGLS